MAARATESRESSMVSIGLRRLDHGADVSIARALTNDGSSASGSVLSSSMSNHLWTPTAASINGRSVAISTVCPISSPQPMLGSCHQPLVHREVIAPILTSQTYIGPQMQSTTTPEVGSQERMASVRPQPYPSPHIADRMQTQREASHVEVHDPNKPQSYYTHSSQDAKERTWGHAYGDNSSVRDSLDDHHGEILIVKNLVTYRFTQRACSSLTFASGTS